MSHNEKLFSELLVFLNTIKHYFWRDARLVLLQGFSHVQIIKPKPCILNFWLALYSVLFYIDIATVKF